MRFHPANLRLRPGRGREPGLVPTISNIAFNGGITYTLTGTQLNGMSEGASYGDDAEMSSNYPIVRLTSSSGTVYYARTFNWSATGVQTGTTPVTTQFTLPANLPAGTYTLNVIANGIASTDTTFKPAVYADTHWAGLGNGTVIADVDPVTAGNQQGTIGLNAFATVNAAISAAPTGGTVIVNGDGSGVGTYGNFSETVAMNKQITLYLQGGPVVFGALAGNAATAAIVLSGVSLSVGGNGVGTEFDGAISGAAD